MTRGDWAGGGVCVGKSEVCHFAIVSNLFRHQSTQKGKHDTQAGSKQVAVAAAAATRQEASQRTAEEANSPPLY
jgi:hypothetical protein